MSAAPTGALLRMTTARAVGTVLFGLILSPSTAAGEQAGLARFVRDAVAGNAAVLAAEAILLAESERQAGAERSYDNPELSIETEDIGAFERGDHEMERRVVVGLTQQLDLHGKRRARTTAAAVRQQIAQAEVDGARAETAAELLHALAGWQTAAVRVTLLEAHEDAMEEFEALAGRQEAAGDISRMEAGLATLALAETRMSRVAAEVERSLAAQGVRNVTFAGEETTWPALDFALPPLGEVAVEDVSVLPVVRAASLRARAAAAEVDVSR
ncbi:MAG: TolC family protein, partial [Gammaproteobacteria bacterium]|nr:TolC family protein [Gammaproteobacteria bacterium]